MARDDEYFRRLRERAWFVPGHDAFRIEDPEVFAVDRRSPVSGRGTAFSWYRPGELLVRRDAAAAAEYLSQNGAARWAPERSGHWRNAGDRRVDERLVESLSRLAGAELWTVPIDTDLPALIEGARRADPDGAPAIALNHVAFGEPNGKYMGGPGGPPTSARRPKIPEAVRKVGSETVDISVLDTGLPFDWADGGTYRLQGVILDEDVQGTSEWDLLDADGDKNLDRQAAHGLFICGLINRHAPELRIDPSQVLHSDGSGDEVEIISQGLDAVRGRVVNMSLGCYTDDNQPPPTLATAIRALLASGVVIVAAAGNNGADPDYRGRKFFPAAMCGVIGVGAYDSRSTPPVVAPFSNRGTWIDVWAPGVELVSDYVPDWAVPSPDWADPAEPPVPQVRGSERSTDFVHWSGTSFAAPLVAAELARLVRADPGAAQAIAEQFLDGLPFDPMFGRMFDAGTYTS